MNNKVLGVLAFSLGAAIGSLVTYKVLVAKFNKMLEDEIEAAKDYYSGDRATTDKSEEQTVAESEEIDPAELDKQHYVELLKKYRNEEDTDMCEPYVIPPEDFGELADYETVSLTYYADGVLTDEDNEPIDDADDIVGADSLNHFGEFEDDSVFVRNEMLKIDYEILKDLRRYSDLVDRDPHPAEAK
jgi:hypothetical protein